MNSRFQEREQQNQHLQNSACTKLLSVSIFLSLLFHNYNIVLQLILSHIGSIKAIPSCKGVDEKKLETIIGNWLRNSSDRVEGGRKKPIQQQQQLTASNNVEQPKN